MTMEWERVARTADKTTGESTVLYASITEGGEDNITEGMYQIESRKRYIEHAARPGGWYHTTYWLLNTDTEYQSLKDAQKAAQQLYESGRIR